MPQYRNIYLPLNLGYMFFCGKIKMTNQKQKQKLYTIIDNFYLKQKLYL